MHNKSLYLTDGTLFANDYNRIVRGDRGDYIELEKQHIVQELISKFGNDLTMPIDKYYFWLHPINKPKYKIYLQLKTVKYADYKVGKYYISPASIRNYEDPEVLHFKN